MVRPLVVILVAAVAAALLAPIARDAGAGRPEPGRPADRVQEASGAGWPPRGAGPLAPFPTRPRPVAAAPGAAAAVAAAAAAPRGPSRSVGRPESGRLVNGRLFPVEGADHFTWDFVRRRAPNRAWRRWGTARLVRVVQRVLHEFAVARPTAPRVGVGDLSRPRGGPFGARFGGIGHATHQNGLDADVYYPRRDRREREAWRPGQVHRRLAQDLVDRFVRAGALAIYVGPSLRLRGPRRIVVPLVHHDDHLHVRIRARSDGR